MASRVRQLRLVVEAADYDRAVAFYRDELGLAEEASYAGPGEARVTILDAGRASLELANPAHHRHVDEVEVGRPVAGHLRVAFEVSDTRRCAERLVERGAELVAAATPTPWHSLNARLDAPAGLHVTLFEELREPALAPAYPIRTERLLLRPIDPVADLDAMHAYLCREDVCRYIPPVPRSRERLARDLSHEDRTRSVLHRDGQALSLAVEVEATGELVGDVVLFWHSEEHRTGEIGYVINPDFSGRGYATEAGRALLGLAFDGLGLHRVTARIDQDNPASAAVLRKLGMRQEAVLVENEWFKGRWSTEVRFAMLEQEWRDRSR